MIILPGEGIDDAEISVPCPNCTEHVPVPPVTVRKLIKQLNKRKIRAEKDNLPFKYHHVTIIDKKNMQARELLYIRRALEETEDLKEYAELTRRYIRKQRLFLTTLREAASAYRHVGELIEETTTEYFAVVNRAMNRNSSLDGDIEDIRAKCETLRKENRNFERYRRAALRTSYVYSKQYSSARK